MEHVTLEAEVIKWQNPFQVGKFLQRNPVNSLGTSFFHRTVKDERGNSSFQGSANVMNIPRERLKFVSEKSNIKDNSKIHLFFYRKYIFTSFLLQEAYLDIDSFDIANKDVLQPT